jgi:hypothetical protein
VSPRSALDRICHLFLGGPKELEVMDGKVSKVSDINKGSGNMRTVGKELRGEAAAHEFWWSRHHGMISDGCCRVVDIGDSTECRVRLCCKLLFVD